MKENTVNVHIDLNNPDFFALELTKFYLEKNSDDKYSSPKDFVGIFILAYSRILAELESIRQNDKLVNSIVSDAMKMDFSIYENVKED